MKKFFSKNKYMILMLIVAFVIVSATSSFAFYTFYREGIVENTIHTGGLSLAFDDSNSLSILNNNAYPVSDSIGIKTNPYTFNLSSGNSMDVKYQINVIKDMDAIGEDGCSDKLLDFASLKYQLIIDGVEGAISKLSNDGLIDSGIIGSNENHDYELRLWISDDAGKEVMNKHFHGKISLTVMTIEE